MPNYSIVANSVFQPFTYQELALPLDRQDAYHENLMQQYEQLSDKADVLEAMGANDRDKDSQSYNRFKAYSDALRAEADNLYRHGLGAESRLRLTDIRRRFNQEIVPIQNAWNKREQEAEMQMKARMSNPNLRFTRDAVNTSLDEYVNNPMGGYGVVNLANITAQMAGMAKNLEKQIRSGQLKDIDDYTRNYVTKYGLDANIINDWIDNPNKNKALTNMMNQVLTANGVTAEALKNSPNAASLINEATKAAQTGAWEAIGEDKQQMVENYYNREMLKASIDLQKDRAKAAMAAAAAGAAGGAGSMIDTSEYELPMMGADYSGNGEQQKAMKTLGYKMVDGTLKPTGRATINGKEVSLYGRDGRIMNRSQFVGQAKSAEDRKEYGKYFDKMVEAGKTLGIYGKMYTQNELANQYRKLVDNSASQFARVYAFNYGKDDWNPNTRNYPIREIKSYKGGKPVFDTEKITLNDLLNKKDANKNNINVSAYWSNVAGQQGLILATNEDGKNHRYFIDARTMPENNIQSALKLFKDAEEAKKAIRTAKTETDRKAFEEIARTKIESAIGALHTGFTINYPKFNQKVVEQPSAKQRGLIGE